MRKRYGVVLPAVLVGLVMLLGAASAFASDEFSDVPATHQFHDAISNLAQLDIVDGFTDGTFRPDQFVNRAQMAKILVLAKGIHDEEVDNQGNPTFPDVAPSMGIPYPFDFVEEAAEADFFKGDNQGKFNPFSNIARVQLVLTIVRAGGNDLPQPPADYSTGFTDTSGLTQEAQAAIRIAKFNNILSGKTATTFDPWSSATRGHVAKMVSNLLAIIGEPGAGTVLQGKVTNTAGQAVPAHIEISDPATDQLIAETDTDASGNFSVALEEHSGGTYVKAIPNAAETFFENQEFKFVVADQTNTRDIMVSAKTPANATFMGIATCSICHSQRANSYRETFHFRSIQEDLSEFNPTGWPEIGGQVELSFLVALRGESTATVNPVLLHPAEGHYAVRIGSEVLSVDGTYGGLEPDNPEWKQRYLTKVPEEGSTLDETSNQDYLIIPIQWNQNQEFDRARWVAYSATNWWNTSTRTFAKQCAGCHNTASHIVFNESSQVVHYEYKDLNITCEKCHGPGSAHVAAGGGKAVAIVNPSFMMDLESQEICGQCHNRGESVEPEGSEYPWNESLGGEYQIGADLIDWITWTFEAANGFAGNKVENPGFYWIAAEGSERYPNGYIAAQKHHEQINDLVQGVMPMVKCAECHDVHGTPNRRNLRGDPNGSTAATNACTAAGACHVHDSVFEADSGHMEAGLLTMGQVNFDCSWCHMAETAASAEFFKVDEAGTYKQGDIANHTFWPIPPDTMDRNGARVPDSCNMIGCHSDVVFTATQGMFDAKAAIVGAAD